MAPIQPFLDTSNSLPTLANKANSKQNSLFSQTLQQSIKYTNTILLPSWAAFVIQCKSPQTKIKTGLRKTKLFTPLFHGMTSSPVPPTGDVEAVCTAGGTTRMYVHSLDRTGGVCEKLYG